MVAIWSTSQKMRRHWHAWRGRESYEASKHEHKHATASELRFLLQTNLTKACSVWLRCSHQSSEFAAGCLLCIVCLRKFLSAFRGSLAISHCLAHSSGSHGAILRAPASKVQPRDQAQALDLVTHRVCCHYVEEFPPCKIQSTRPEKAPVCPCMNQHTSTT